VVRAAGARALAAIDSKAAARVLERLRQGDPESRVRATARQLLEPQKP
jgi:HEAT repeat protein